MAEQRGRSSGAGDAYAKTQEAQVARKCLHFYDLVARCPPTGGSSAVLPVVPPPLTSVAVVCRAQPSIAAIPAIVENVDAFLDVSSLWTIPTACKLGVPGAGRLLTRIAAREDREIDPFYKRSLFRAGLASAAERGDLDTVQWLMEVYLPAGRVREAVQTAAEAGQLHVLQWLHAHHSGRVVWGESEMYKALGENHVETARWLYNNIPSAREVDNQLIQFAMVRSGGSDVAEWLRETNRLPSLDLSKLLGVARRGNVALVEWAVDRLHVALDERFMDVAARTGNLRLMKFLASLGSPAFLSVDADPLCEAARNGIPGVLCASEWSLRVLTVRNKPALVRAIDHAARYGRLDIVKLLHEQCPGHCSVDAMDSAAACGHLEVVQWLHEHRSEGCSAAAMDRAASNGHVDVVKWLHENRAEGCTSVAMDSTAENGHLEIFQWLHKHRNEGCTTQAMDQAARNGWLDVVKWLHAHRSEGCTVNAMANAAASGNLELVEWLHCNRDEGCTAEAMNEAARHGHLDIVRWLHEHRSEGRTATAMHRALSVPHFHVVQWLHERCGEPLTEDTLCAAVSDGDVGMVRWVLARIDAPTFSPRPVEIAVGNGDFKAMFALRADGRCVCNGKYFASVFTWSGRLEVLQWLVHNRLCQAPTVVLPQVSWRDCRRELETLHSYSCRDTAAVLAQPPPRARDTRSRSETMIANSDRAPAFGPYTDMVTCYRCLRATPPSDLTQRS